ncbi:MAG: DUF998 domain-containing protein [Solirubrobacterales bacterium]
MNHITTTSDTTSILCFFAVLAAVLSALSLVIVHFLPTGVNPVSEAVSDYGVGKYKNFYRLAAFWLGAAGLLVAIALARAIFPKPTLTILALLVFAAVRWSITIFPTDLPGEDETSVGKAHETLAAIAFSSIAVAAGFFWPAVSDDPFWNPHRGLLTALAAAVIVAVIATGLTRRVVLKQYFGLVERLLYVTMFAWLIAVAAILA